MRDCNFKLLSRDSIDKYFEINILTEEKIHTGIILSPQQRYLIGEQLRGLLQIIAEKRAEDMINQLVFLSKYIRE